MATVTLRNVPDNLYEKLKKRAEQNRRSMNSEAIICLGKVLESEQIEPEKLLVRAQKLRSRFDNIQVTDQQIGAAKGQGRE